MKTLLILVDGMRPDALDGVPQAQEMMKKASYTLCASTVMPSVTLPCHMSLFHSVDPSRHGTTTNVYAPQVRPVEGLCEALGRSRKTCAFFYNWEELRDLTRPGSLTFSFFCKGKQFGYDKANEYVTDAAIAYLTAHETDFAFVYLGDTDEVGHKYGWMSEEYRESVHKSWAQIERLLAALTGGYTVIVTADHGGHDRIHGTELPEDMTIPVLIQGPDFAPGKELENVNIKDLAPTVAKLLGVEPDPDWEGRSLV